MALYVIYSMSENDFRNEELPTLHGVKEFSSQEEANDFAKSLELSDVNNEECFEDEVDFGDCEYYNRYCAKEVNYL